MKPINILPPQIFNMLAAGEVVENPASVVKECVENSIDAGATAITVAIKNGGINQITITDNGHGVEQSQVEKIFLPHATSKITNANDLESIQTLGFRGEAMSSIASVSQVTITTKVRNANMATRMELSAGDVISKQNIAASNGTQVVIKNLFFNIPARKKFLKSANIEKNNVTSCVQKLILSNPNMSVKYVVDDEIIYNFVGGGLSNAIKTIFGVEVTQNMLPINTPELSGFVSVPSYTKRNRTWQTAMINGRVVSDGIIADAANDAFSNYMTSGNFPFFVLNLNINFASVDVNVHPRKAEVHFEDPTQIHQKVKSAITAAIDKHLFERARVFAPSSTHLPTKVDTPKTDIAAEIKATLKYFTSQVGQHSVKSAPETMNMFDKKYFSELSPTQ